MSKQQSRLGTVTHLVESGDVFRADGSQGLIAAGEYLVVSAEHKNCGRLDERIVAMVRLLSERYRPRPKGIPQVVVFTRESGRKESYEHGPVRIVARMRQKWELVERE